MGITSSAPKPATVSNPQGNTSTLEKWGNMFSGTASKTEEKIVPPPGTGTATVTAPTAPVENRGGGKRKKSKSSRKSKKRTGKKTAKK